MFFDIQPEDESIIKVIGVGGGGSNAVNFMYKQGISGVNFIICNTDQQALASSEVPNKIQLGPSLTGGRGAGAKPEVGKEATLESEEEIRKALGPNTQMVFVTAGMGGGTGTGGAPVIAKIAKDMGILTVGIVTVPFSFEGKSKRDKADSGLEDLKNSVDSLIVISNNKLREVYGNLSLTAAFSHADNVLTTAARGISEIITKPGLVNVDFEDVKTVMQDSGVAIMGIGVSSGEGRATKAIDEALSSPLLDENDIYGARGILLYISSGSKEVTMDEVSQITDYVQQASNNDTEIIWGVCHDESLEDEVSVTLIATGFKNKDQRPTPAPEKKEIKLEANFQQPIAQATVASTTHKEVLKLEETSSVKYEKTDTPSFDIDFSLEDTISDLDLSVEEVKKEEKPLFVIKHIETESQQTDFEEPQEAVEQAPQAVSSKANTNKDFLRRKINPTPRYRDPKYIEDMERTPSYERKNRRFESVPHSSESHISRYTITDDYEDEEGNTLHLKQNPLFREKPD